MGAHLIPSCITHTEAPVSTSAVYSCLLTNSTNVLGGIGPNSVEVLPTTAVAVSPPKALAASFFGGQNLGQERSPSYMWVVVLGGA